MVEQNTTAEDAMLDLMDWLWHLPDEVLITGGYNVGHKPVTGKMIYNRAEKVLELIRDGK